MNIQHIQTYMGLGKIPESNMFPKGLARSLGLFLLFVIQLAVGCDRFREAVVIIDPRISSSEGRFSDDAQTQKIISTVKAFSSKINFDCNLIFQPPNLLECGPAWHRKITLSKKDDIFIITLFEMHPGWIDSPFFCSVQGQMKEFLIKEFGQVNIKIETNDSCVKS